MRADTQTIAIYAAPEAVLDFVAEGTNLPRWAIGFAKSVARSGETWVVTTAQGLVRTTIRRDDASGTVDFVMDMGSAGEAVAYTRVLPNADGSEFVFTQFQGTDVSDDVFEQLVTAVGHELTTLKAMLEVECPL